MCCVELVLKGMLCAHLGKAVGWCMCLCFQFVLLEIKTSSFLKKKHETNVRNKIKRR